MFHTHVSPGAGTIGQIVADIQTGLSLTPPHKTEKNLNMLKNVLQHMTRGGLRINIHA
jgi:hypothetical protein